ncbi:MAG: ABC transporter ATP-binding protein [Candidatus Niyogibacteria bacterium]|nr:ABC transporter ATP-binding protein [Candidatus Niyogibacteria bacterium]
MERLEQLKRNQLHLQDVHKWYGPKRVLDDIDLSVRAGEFCTVVGPSGCGKSTLLRLIIGQERATSGTLLMEGEPIKEPSKERGIVFQRYPLFEHLSVFDNVYLGRRLSVPWWGRIRRRKEFRDEIMEHLSVMRLAEHAKKYPYELSGGMQQRVAIAQTILMRPKILLMDEPFGALDPSTRESMQVHILKLWEEHKTTIFFVTHDLEEAAYLGTRLLVLSQYYTDGRGDDPKINRGARIVGDHPLSRHALSTDVKKTADFGAFIQMIRHEGFDPSNRMHVTKFNLKHPDSFQTLTDEERR